MVLEDLVKSAMKFDPGNVRMSQKDSVEFENVKAEPMAGIKSVTVNALTISKTFKAKRKYKTIVAFYGLDFSEKEKPGMSNVKDLKNNITWWVEQPTLSQSKVRVACSCHDFYFTGALWVYNEGGLFGRKPRAYIRKTTNYPERNALHIPMICKHIWHLTDILIQNGWLINK